MVHFSRIAGISSLLAAGVLGTADLPQTDKVRGVNLGGLFIVEAWMMPGEWANMGCSGRNDEWACIQAGVSNQNFVNHWSNWITEADIQQIANWGLNTIRIPVGHWIVESTINSGEFWPRGGFTYLKRLLGWMTKYGLYAIIDLHGAPGGQTANQQFTGHSVSTPGFFTSANFARAEAWAKNITISAHQDPNFASVFAIEVLNEPANNGAQTGLINTYYPGVFNTIRSTEQSLGITCKESGLSSRFGRLSRSKRASNYNDCLNIMFMDTAWGSGDPTSNLPNTDHTLYDGHNYFAYGSPPTTRSGLISAACNANQVTSQHTPVIFGEFSMATQNENGELSPSSSGATAFYQQFIGSQIYTWEKGAGWTFWTYKTETDYQWSYSNAVKSGVIPTDATKIASQQACTSSTGPAGTDYSGATCNWAGFNPGAGPNGNDCAALWTKAAANSGEFWVTPMSSFGISSGSCVLQFCNWDSTNTIYYDWADFATVGQLIDTKWINGNGDSVAQCIFVQGNGAQYVQVQNSANVPNGGSYSLSGRSTC